MLAEGSHAGTLRTSDADSAVDLASSLFSAGSPSIESNDFSECESQPDTRSPEPPFPHGAPALDSDAHSAAMHDKPLNAETSREPFPGPDSPESAVVIVSPRFSPKPHAYERRLAGGQSGSSQPAHRSASGGGGAQTVLAGDGALSAAASLPGPGVELSSAARFAGDGRFHEAPQIGREEETGLLGAGREGQGAEGGEAVRLWARSRAWLSLPVLRALGLILLWYAFSMCLSLYNKFLIGHQHGSFPAPLLMTTVHFLLQFLLSWALLRCAFPHWMPAAGLPWREYATRVIPTATATAMDIALSNLSLAFITLTFYTMCKSSAPVFLLLFAFAFRIEEPSWKLTGIMVVISLGVLFTVFGETHFNGFGFVLIMMSAVTSGLRWVLIQVLLQKDKLGLTNPLVTLMYLTPVMAAVCAVFSLLHEPLLSLPSSPYFSSPLHAAWTSAVIAFGALLAFFMIMSEFLLVLETSAVTFAVAGTVKEGATILVSHVVFGDRFTRVNLLGIFIILIGVSLFNFYKYSRESHPSPPPPPAVGREWKSAASSPSGRDEGLPPLPPHELQASAARDMGFGSLGLPVGLGRGGEPREAERLALLHPADEPGVPQHRPGPAQGGEARAQAEEGPRQGQQGPVEWRVEVAGQRGGAGEARHGHQT